MGAEIGMSSCEPGDAQAKPSWPRHGRLLPSNLQREHSPADTLVLDSWPPELRGLLSVFEAIKTFETGGRPSLQSGRNLAE